MVHAAGRMPLHGDVRVRWIATAALAACGTLFVASAGALAPDGAIYQKQAAMAPVIFTAAPVYVSLAALVAGSDFRRARS